MNKLHSTLACGCKTCYTVGEKTARGAAVPAVKGVLA